MPFTAVPASDRVENNSVQCLRKRISVPAAAGAVTVGGAASTTVTIGALPPGAVVIGGGIYVSTLFNSSGTDLMSIGTINSAGTSTTAVWASAVDVSSTGLKALTALTVASTATSYSDTADLTVTTTFAQSVTDATTGMADVVLFYQTRPVT
jgi:hypothetical protein